MQELFTLLKTWIHPQLFVVFVLIDCFLFNAFKSYSALSIFLRFTESDYSFGIFKLVLSIFFWLLCCMSFFDLRILITLLVSSNSSCLFSFSHCVACPSSFFGFWLPLWYLQSVCKCKLDGSNQQSIITDNISNPYGISLGIIYIYLAC
jgi:hypothetical protein